MIGWVGGWISISSTDYRIEARTAAAPLGLFQGSRRLTQSPLTHDGWRETASAESDQRLPPGKRNDKWKYSVSKLERIEPGGKVISTLRGLGSTLRIRERYLLITKTRWGHLASQESPACR